jgi:hypothetical protein
MFVIVSQKKSDILIMFTKIRQCLYRAHRNLSVFVITSTKIYLWTITVTHLNNITSFFITLNFLSLSRYPSGFSDQIFCYVSFFRHSTYRFSYIYLLLFGNNVR